MSQLLDHGAAVIHETGCNSEVAQKKQSQTNSQSACGNMPDLAPDLGHVALHCCDLSV